MAMVGVVCVLLTPTPQSIPHTHDKKISVSYTFCAKLLSFVNCTKYARFYHWISI